MIACVFARIDESFGEDTALDLPGVALAAGAALGVVWGLVRGNAAGWGSFEVVGALTSGTLLIIAFVAWERRAREPMLPMRFFRSRAFSAGNATTVLQFASTLGTVFFLAQFLQISLGYDALQAGLAVVPWTATLFFVAPVAGALTDRIGRRPLAVGGLLLQAGGMAWIALIAAPDLAYGALVVPLIVGGIGASAAIPAVQTVVIGAVAEGAVGKAAGTNAFMRELGGVLESPHSSPSSREPAAMPRRPPSATGSRRRSGPPPSSPSPARSPASSSRLAAGRPNPPRSRSRPRLHRYNPRKRGTRCSRTPRRSAASP